MATNGKLVMAALTALAAAGAAGAGFGVDPVLPTTPAPKRPAAKALVADPAEPPMTVQVSCRDDRVGGFVLARGDRAVRPVAAARRARR